MADSTTSNGFPAPPPSLHAPPPRAFAHFPPPPHFDFAPRGRPAFMAPPPPGAFAPPPAFYHPPPRAPYQPQAHLPREPREPRTPRVYDGGAQRPPRVSRASGKAWEPRGPGPYKEREFRPRREYEDKVQPARFHRGPAQDTPSHDIQTVPAPVVPPQFVTASEEAALAAEREAPVVQAPQPQPQPQQPAPFAPRTAKEPEQRMRRVLARDHSFCYRCARTGHYTKDCMWFKTQLCKYWQEGNCRHGLKNGENVCMYAHGQDELRPVTPSWCIRVVHDNGNMLVFGCGGAFHTPETCPQVLNQLPPAVPPPV